MLITRTNALYQNKYLLTALLMAWFVCTINGSTTRNILNIYDYGILGFDLDDGSHFRLSFYQIYHTYESLFKFIILQNINLKQP